MQGHFFEEFRCRKILNISRHGHNPEAYLADVLERIPAMTNQDDLGALLPSRWQPANAASPAVDVADTVCEC